MSKWLHRRYDAPMPYNTWRPFPDEAIVQVKGIVGQSTIAQAKNLWWGYEEEFGGPGEGVITACRRLDKPLPAPPAEQPRGETNDRKYRNL